MALSCVQYRLPVPVPSTDLAGKRTGYWFVLGTGLYWVLDCTGYWIVLVPDCTGYWFVLGKLIPACFYMYML